MTDTGYTAVATQKHPLMVYADRFEARTDEIKNMLPPGISAERFKRACRTAAQLNPEILGCTWSSIWNSAAKACREGLLPDGVHAAFVPYKSVCTYLPMVRGRLLQFQQSGAAKWVTAQCVYEGDEFAHYIDEHGEHLRHTPSDVFDDKKIVRAYAMATTKDGAVFIRVMPRAEIDKHRSFSRTKRDDAPWVVHYAEMAKKTVLHGLAKMLPNAPMIDEGFDDDDEEETRPQLAAVNPNRERGAAAALDAFAGSPDATDGTVHRSSGAVVDDDSGGTGGSGDTRHESAQTHEPTAPADDTTARIDLIAEAKVRGAQAKADGHQRKALPPEYRTPERDAEAQAWLAGWDGK